MNLKSSYNKKRNKMDEKNKINFFFIINSSVNDVKSQCIPRGVNKAKYINFFILYSMIYLRLAPK